MVTLNAHSELNDVVPPFLHLHPPPSRVPILANISSNSSTALSASLSQCFPSKTFSPTTIPYEQQPNLASHL